MRLKRFLLFKHSNRWVLGALNPGINQLERNADNSHPFSDEVKKWSYNSITPYAHYILP